jgi:hypothetical protein
MSVTRGLTDLLVVALVAALGPLLVAVRRVLRTWTRRISMDAAGSGWRCRSSRRPRCRC